jgi:TolB protein
MTRRTLYLPALIVASVLMACAAAVATLLAVPAEGAGATFFPGQKNGKIAYHDAFDESGPFFGSIYTINPGGGANTKVTAGYQPSYSPDGKRIAYWAYDKSSPIRDTEIYTINVSGGDKTQLTHNNTDEFSPTYSPDGKRIAYTGLAGLERNNAESDVYTINAAGGGGKTQVTSTDNLDEGDPSYSPDGKRIAYSAYKGNAIRGDIYTIKVGGGGKFRVTHTDKADEADPSWGSRTSWPSWQSHPWRLLLRIAA